MKLSARREALFGQLQTVTRAASTRSAVQALSGVQLQATADGIELAERLHEVRWTNGGRRRDGDPWRVRRRRRSSER